MQVKLINTLMTTNNHPPVSSNGMLMLATVTFIALSWYTSGSLLVILNLAGLACCIALWVALIMNKYGYISLSPGFRQNSSTILLTVSTMIWLVLINERSEWFASWKWATFIFVVLLLVLFGSEYERKSLKRGVPAVYIALTWLSIWYALHFFKSTVSNGPNIPAICWCVYTSIAIVFCAYTYARNRAEVFMLSVLFLCCMDMCYYQLYPLLEYGEPIGRSIPWMNG